MHGRRIGERAGNAALEEVVLALALHGGYLGRTLSVDTRSLMGVCRLVSDRSGIGIAPNKAIAGENIFATESGIHQDGLLKDVQTYQPFPPEIIGAQPGFRLVLGKHSGRSALEHRLSGLDVALSPAEVDELLRRIKALERPSDPDEDSVL